MPELTKFIRNRNDSKSSLDNVSLHLLPFIDRDPPARNNLRRNSISLPALSKVDLQHLQHIDEITNGVRHANNYIFIITVQQRFSMWSIKTLKILIEKMKIKHFISFGSKNVLIFNQFRHKYIRLLKSNLILMEEL